MLMMIFHMVFFTLLSVNFLWGDDHFHICTVASYKNENLDKLITSCQKHNIELKILGFNQPYYGNGTKLLRLNEYLENLADDDIVMFVDAFDVLIIRDKEIILRKFLARNAPFIMSAEQNCYPFAKLASQYPETAGPFRFINSGCFIGYVLNLKAWLLELSPFQVDKSDQGQITKHYLKNRSTFVLDHECELFLTLFKMSEEEIAIDENEKIVRCLITGSEPCVIHANGKSFKLWDMIFEKLVCD